jgi:hypothetical protein
MKYGNAISEAATENNLSQRMSRTLYATNNRMFAACRK